MIPPFHDPFKELDQTKLILHAAIALSGDSTHANISSNTSKVKFIYGVKALNNNNKKKEIKI